MLGSGDKVEIKLNLKNGLKSIIFFVIIGL
nr:MAG TPA: hypothetical protein [Caudoviricetes sp.]